MTATLTSPQGNRLVLFAGLTLLCFGACRSQEMSINAAPIITAPVAETATAEAVRNLLAESSQDLAQGDRESAIRAASTAIQLDPRNASAYELRGSVYIEEKLWDRADRDYVAAAKISPDVVYKYKLGEIKFLAKSYEDARPRFVAIEGDEHLGSLASYKAFLCDLLGRHDATAVRDLAALDTGGRLPAYYFCHAAWSIYHGDRVGAMKYFGAAQQVYDRGLCDIYIASLLETRQFQLATATFVDRDGIAYQNASIFPEEDGLRVSNATGWVTLPYDKLPDDLAPFPEDVREQIDRKRVTTSDAPVPESLVSFTTRSGPSYDQVRWSIADTGLSILTPTGWITLPFQDLPADQSSFPADLKQALARPPLIVSSTSSSQIVEVSFTTAKGKPYTQQKAVIAHEGLRLLTPDGWITMPFRDLSNDLSGFPNDWQTQIRFRRRTPTLSPTGMETISITTIKGIHYDQIRASIGSNSLRMITSRGWEEVPFKDLPPNLSNLPEAWRQAISSKRADMAKNKSGG